MLNGHRTTHTTRSKRALAVQFPPEVELVEPSLQKFWSEKYFFSVSTLRLNKEKARAWATRAVRVKLQMAESEFEYAQ